VVERLEEIFLKKVLDRIIRAQAIQAEFNLMNRFLTKKSILILSCVLLAVVIGTYLLGYYNRDAVKYEGSVAAAAKRKKPTGLKLFVFQAGIMPGQGWGVYKGGGFVKVDMDQPSFLIKHPRRGMILYETGFSPQVAMGGADYVGGFLYHTELLQMNLDKGQDVRSQLTLHGFDPEKVKHIFVSHFHPEHGGAVESFPSAYVAVDRREYDYAMSDPAYNFFKKEYDNVKLWKLLDFHDKPTLEPFGGYIDFFGDGSVLVVSTAGHTPGHISILLHLDSGPIMLTGDIAWRMKNIETESIGFPIVSVDGYAHRISLGKLIAFRKKNPHITFVPGHDLGPLRRLSDLNVKLYPWPAQH